MKKVLNELARIWLAMAIAASISAFAASGVNEGFQDPSPDELKMTAEPLAPGAPAIIL